MLRDIVNKGRELADKVTNMVMNFTEVEAKVREATSDEPWGPHPQVMQQIAEYTFCHGTYMEVMCTLWRRMHVEYARNWRRVYKSLILLDFLLKNGSEQVASSAREHIYDIRTLESFQYHDEHGKDQGINVRIKVQAVINLIQDPDQLKVERQKAKDNRHTYTGYNGSDSMSWGGSFNQARSSYGSSRSFAKPDPESPSNSSFRQTQQHRLSNFDDWNVGRERGIVDDVVEQMKEAWDIAKMTTKDILFKPNADADFNEVNPRMVSEEMYEFPSGAVEVEGAYDSDGTPDQRTNHFRSFPSKGVDHPKRISRRDEEAVHPSSVRSMPRPPSVEPPPSSDSRPCNLPSAAESVAPVDLLNLDSNPTQDSSWPSSAQPTQQPPVSLWPESESNVAPTDGSTGGDSSLFDSEFTAFVSATPAQQPLSVSNGAVPSNADSLDWLICSPPVAAVKEFNGHMDLFGQQAPLTGVKMQPTTHVAQLPSALNPLESTSKAQPSKVGKTWKAELGTLGIDLDSLAMPKKLAANRHGTGPSLHQLKQQASVGPSSPAHSNSQASRSHAAPSTPVSGFTAPSPMRSSVPPMSDFSLI